jgi:hypothetical protein
MGSGVGVAESQSSGAIGVGQHELVSLLHAYYFGKNEKLLATCRR